jgi:hypothetical protein
MELTGFLDEFDQGIDGLAHDELSMNSRDALQAMDSTHLKHCHSRAVTAVKHPRVNP